MLDYFIYLLSEYNTNNSRILSIRNTLPLSQDNSKFIVNIIYNTELKIYLNKIIDYKQEKYDIEPNLTIKGLLSLLNNNLDLINNNILESIASSHYNPIWKMASFFTDIILQLHYEYTS